MTDVNSYTRKQLLDLPRRKWDFVCDYDSLLLVPSRLKHDSGWHLIAIVGCDNQKPVEVTGYCDAISWHVNPDVTTPQMRTDMTHPSGCTHIWGCSECFEVGITLSSTDITVKRKEAKCPTYPQQ